MTESSTWINIHDKRKKPFFYYRKLEAYAKMNWMPNEYKELDFTIDMSQLICSVSPYGGPIAFTREVWNYAKEEKAIIDLGWTDDLKLMVLTQAGHLHVFDCRGKEIKGPWKNEKQKKGKSANTNSAYLELAKTDHIIMSQMWSQGCAVFTEEGRLFVATDILQQEKPWVEYKTGGVDKIYSMEVVPPEFSPTRKPQVLISPNQIEDIPKDEYEADPRDKGIESGKRRRRTVIVCRENEFIDLQARQGPFRKMSLSPNGQYIALFSEDGYVCVIPNHFGGFYLKLRTGLAVNKLGNANELVPKQMVWCNNLGVLVYWEKPDSEDSDNPKSLLLLVGCFGDYYGFDYDTPIFLKQEVDCCRIFTPTSCEILEQVNDHAVDIFRIGSLENSALLYDAYLDYKKKKPSSIKTIMDIRGKRNPDEVKEDGLDEAVIECLNAACHEFSNENSDDDLQTKLLKAAAYGRSFSSERWENKDEFLQKCKELRVLNSIREKKIGIPITYQQYKVLTPQALVGRLAEMHQHYLAIKICEYLDIEKNEILIDWACTKATKQLKKGIDDPETLKKQQELWTKQVKEEILEKLKDVSLAHVALTAFNAKNKVLAKGLLGYEDKIQEEKEYVKVDDTSDDFNKAPEQIPLYVKMDEISLALDQAVSSVDSDLLYLVILYILKKGDRTYLYDVAQTNAYIRRLFVSYCREENYKILTEFYEACGKKRSLGYLNIREAYENEKFLKEKLEKALQNFNQSDKYEIDSVLTQEQISLIDYQAKIIKLIKKQKLQDVEQEQEEILQVIGSSFNETIYFCLLKAKNEKFKEIGLKMKKEFEMPKRRYWWLKVRSLAELKDWRELEKFAEREEGVSPIGFVPFVDACLAWNNETEALKYIPKVENPKNKIDYYIGLTKPMFKEAIQTAAELLDLDLLEYIANKTENQKTRDTIQALMDEIIAAQ